MMGSPPGETHNISHDLTAELFPGLSYEEAIEDQETLYEVLRIIASDETATSSTSQRSSGRAQNSQSWDEPYLSGNVDVNSQLALDEAMARALQEMEDGIDDISISGTAHNATENEGDTSAHVSANTSASSSAMGQHEDEALPEMTYEELLSLGEAIGTESRGLSQSAIDSLATFKLKTGLFSKKGKHGDCAICISDFRNNDYITSLPCAHRYHKECIDRWLKDKKNCPICQMEVNLSS